MVNAEIALLETERKSIGAFHILHLVLTVLSFGLGLILWVIHGFVVSSFNSRLDKRIKVTKLIIRYTQSPARRRQEA